MVSYGPRTRESRAIFCGRDAERAPKRTAQRLFVLEAAPPRDPLESIGAILDATTRLFDTHALHEGRRRHADGGVKLPRKMPHAHSRHLRERLHRELPIEMLQHPELQLPKAVLALLRLQVATELGLSSGALEKHHE